MIVLQRFLLLLLLVVFTADANNFLISEKSYRTLSKVEEQLQQQEYASALEDLDYALSKRGLSGYERALFQRLAGNAFIGAGNHVKAMVRFKEVLESASLPDAVLRQVKYQLAQLYLYEERYQSALLLFKECIKESPQPSAEMYFLTASTYAKLDRFLEALEWGERGLAQADKPSERQYALVADLNVMLKRYLRAADLLEHLIEDYPQTSRYWRQLLGVYLALGRNEQALAIAKLGYLQSVLIRDTDIDRLANLYLHQGVPYEAAVLLEAELQSNAGHFDATRYRLLAQAWAGAHEYNRVVLSLQEVLKILRASRNFSAHAEIHLLKGIAHVRLNQHNKAEQEFEQCLKFDKTHDAANEWLAYLAKI